MKMPIVAGIAILALAVQAPTAGLAQPRPRATHERHHDREPPPGWGAPQWRYRQDYVRRHEPARDEHDDAIIAGLLGFALGAAIAGSHQDKARVESHRDDREWIASCARRYRSFDPVSGTYLGKDGLRHYCR